MFKIVENVDGSTSVFCSESGRLICTVKGKKPSPVAIISRPPRRPQATKRKAIAVGELTISYSGLPKEDSPHEKKQRIKFPHECRAWTESINSDNNSYASTSEASSCEELSDECVDQFSFLQAFDLIGTAELRSKKPEELRGTFPLRSISRTKPVLPSLHPVQRPFDEIELCSPLGVRVSQARHRLGPSAVEQAAKKYDKYCKFSVLSLHPNLTLHPALRNREILKYPITFRPQKGLGPRNAAHLYTFSAHQRQERYRLLTTGLNKRGRYFRRQCKKVCVRLERLTEREIAFRTRRHEPETGHSSGDFPGELTRETLDKFRRKTSAGTSEENACNGRCESEDDDVVMIGEVINNRTSLGIDGEYCYVKREPWTENVQLSAKRKAVIPLRDIRRPLVSTGGEETQLAAKSKAVVPLEDVQRHLVSTGGKEMQLAAKRKAVVPLDDIRRHLVSTGGEETQLAAKSTAVVPFEDVQHPLVVTGGEEALLAAMRKAIVPLEDVQRRLVSTGGDSVVT